LDLIGFTKFWAIQILFRTGNYAVQTPSDKVMRATFIAYQNKHQTRAID